MLARNPRALAFFLLAAGGGLFAWYGEQWYRLPQWSEAEIAQSVELNLALDEQRRGSLLPLDAEKRERLRALVRAEVEADIRRDRDALAKWMGLGAVLMVLGLGQLAFSLGASPRS